MARRIRWQLLIAGVSSLLVLALMGTLALSRAAARPAPGGGYVEGVVGAPEQLNPLLLDPARDPVGADLAALLFEGLTRPGAGGLPEPSLAERWQASEDGTVYTFTLRANLRWHDGEPLTADDVAFTLRTLKRPDFPGPPALSAVWKDVLVDKLDDRRVQFTLGVPYGAFPTIAALPILPEHLLREVPLDAWGAQGFGRKPVGSGPYRLTALDAQRALLTANSDYHGQPPFIEQIELRFFGDTDGALQALDGGEIDALGYLATRQQGPQILPAGIRRYEAPLDEYSVLTFNLRRPPLDRVELRRALAQGLDRTALLTAALDGQATLLDTPILPGWWAYDPQAAWYPADSAKAAETLGELGYTPGPDGVRTRNGQQLTIELVTDTTADRTAAAAEIARQWGTIGVGVEVVPLDGTVLEQRLRDHDFDLALHGWVGLGSDPDVFELWHSSQAAGGANYAGLNDEQIDEALLKGRDQSELAARAQSYASFQQRWIDLVPSIMLYQPLYVYLVQERVGLPDARQAVGPLLLFGRADRFRSVSRWYVNSSREIRSNLPR